MAAGLTFDKVLDRVLRAAEPTGYASLGAWWEVHRATTRGLPPIARAMLGGASADRLAWAFAAGYAAALRELMPGLGEDELAALAATEEGGARPKQILTELRPDGAGFLLHGRKGFVTMATDVAVLFVVARDPASGTPERPALKVVRVARDAPGVALTPLPPTPFVPEIPHATVTFDGVPVAADDVLPGDGYDRYLKPFRTVEDIHVFAAALSWLLAVARRHAFGEAAVARLAALLASVHTLASADPAAPATHVALDGVIRESEGAIAGLDQGWAKVDVETRARWESDRGLFRVAGKVRAQRTTRAFERLAT